MRCRILYAMTPPLLGKGPATKSDDFFEKFRMTFDPPPSFLGNYVAIFYMDMVAYTRRYEGQYEMQAHAFFKVCLVFIFIRPESDHWLCLSLTHSLTHSLTDSCLINLTAMHDTKCLMLSQHLLKAVKRLKQVV